jgi:hypothetical protein
MTSDLSPALETSALPVPRPPAPRRWPPGDAVALAVLIALPVLVFGVPSLLGHPVLPGDDLTQNFPLRVLAGQQIRSGQLPLYDPYIWSGAPLLAGWNAGAAYPLTLLFAVVPATAAWALNLIVTWAAAGTGMFFFLRALRLGSLPSFLGALSFTFAGAMSAQVGHFGLVAGMSWVPVQLLAVLRLSETRTITSRLSWTAVLAGAAGLTILAGEPRAIDDACVIVFIYAAWRIARLGRRCGPAAASVAAGAALGVCLGAVQWLPGLAAISTSQRAVSSAALFDSGSLPHKWLLLMLVPDLLGGSGSFGQPSYFAHYNLAEVTSYVGILPLVAAFALLGRVRLRPRPPEWIVWHVMALAGVILALGGNTPAGPLLMHLPLFGDQRLQSRNILVADLALAVLLAYWADQPFGEPDQRLSPADGARRRRLETFLGILPPLGMIAVVVLALSWGAGLLHWLGVSSGAAAVAGRLKPWLVPYALIGAGAIALVIASRRLQPKLRLRWLGGFIVLDLVVFTLLGVVAVGSGLGSSPTAAAGSATRASRATTASGATTASHGTRAASPSPPGQARAPAPRPIAALGRPGRFAIYDPGEFGTYELPVLGSPDLNVISATPSVQGYSSIVDGRYAAATGSHLATGEGQDVLSPRAIGSGILDQLGTTSLLTVPRYLITTRKRAWPAPGPVGTGYRRVPAEQQGTWYFATQLNVSKLEVPDSDARQDAATGTQIGLVTPGGSTRWFNAYAPSASLLAIHLRHPVASVAMTGRAGGKPCPLGPPSIAVPDGTVFIADGQLQNALVPPRWGFAGHDGSFAVFVDHFAARPLSVQALPGRSASGASVRRLAGPATEPTAAEVSSPHGVRVVRSVAAIPGWSATWHPRDGPVAALTVHRAGLVQAVDVPPGTGVVTWSYVPPGFRLGAALSLTAVVLVLLLILAAPARSGVRAYWRHARSPAPHRH